MLTHRQISASSEFHLPGLPSGKQIRTEFKISLNKTKAALPEVPNTWPQHPAPDTGHLASGTWPWHQAPGPGPGTGHRVPSVWHQAPSVWHLASGTRPWPQAPGTGHRVPSVWHQAPGPRHLAPDRTRTITAIRHWRRRENRCCTAGCDGRALHTVIAANG